MDFLHTLLSFFATATTVAVMALQTILGSALSDEQKITILPPAVPQTKPLSATTSSQALLGTSTKPLSTETAPKPAAKPIASTTPAAQTPASASPPSPAISADLLNTQTRGALVNILCLSQGGGGTRSISGSGVFIDNRGVILTNAHIGQYFLLKDYPTKGNVDCTIRVGSPAQPRYRASLLYLPSAWVASNASQIVAEQGKGTGENDYAFLLVDGATGPSPLPTSFPNLPMVIAEPDLGASVFLAAYPAGFLDGTNIEKNLYPSSAYAAVQELFTFGTGRNVDLISVGGTIVSQGGSSGGAAVRAQDGKLEGIIATATSADTTAQRDLRAITLAHIDRSLTAEGQKGISGLLSQDLAQAVKNFAATVAPGEKDLLVKAIEHK